MTPVTFIGGGVDGTVRPPPSKSRTHRAVVLASLAAGESVIDNALLSDDVLSTVEACRSVGARIDVDGDRLTVHGGNLHAPDRTVDVGNSGTTLRMFTAICSMFDRECTVTGDPSVCRRPMGPLLDALSDQGVECSSEEGCAPVTGKGPNRGGEVSVDGSVSSQFATSLLTVAPMLPEDSGITVTGNVVSRPYLDVTVQMMEEFGSCVLGLGDTFYVKGGKGYVPHDCRIPADWSSAAFPLVAGALGGAATVEGIDLDDIQGDSRITDILKDAGASVSSDGDGVTVRRGELSACDVDMNDIPDLFPIVAVLLSTADGTSRLYGAPQLRHKESDRIASTVRMLNALGGDAEETDDGCIVHGVAGLKGGCVRTEGDHRIAMSAAVASVVCDDPVTVDDMDCCSVSYPGFIRDMGSIGIRTGGS